MNTPYTSLRGEKRGFSVQNPWYGLPSSAERHTLIAGRKTSKGSFGEARKQRPLIRYAGSAAETSIGSKPIGSELSAGFYPWRRGYQNLVRGLSSTNQSSRGLKPILAPSANQAEAVVCPSWQSLGRHEYSFDGIFY
jgi:hypothetical protein